jgi:hypothetical protein
MRTRRPRSDDEDADDACGDSRPASESDIGQSWPSQLRGHAPMRIRLALDLAKQMLLLSLQSVRRKIKQGWE